MINQFSWGGRLTMMMGLCLSFCFGASNDVNAYPLKVESHPYTGCGTGQLPVDGHYCKSYKPHERAKHDWSNYYLIQAKFDSCRLSKVGGTDDILYEFGGGIDFYFEYFKFSIQIKSSIGILNVLNSESSIYSELLTKLKTKGLSLSFFFE